MNNTTDSDITDIINYAGIYSGIASTIASCISYRWGRKHQQKRWGVVGKSTFAEMAYFLLYTRTLICITVAVPVVSYTH